MNGKSSSAKSKPASTWASSSQQGVAEALEGTGESAGQLAESDVQLVRIGGVDHTQDGLGLSQVDASGQKGPQGELARIRPGERRPSKAIGAGVGAAAASRWCGFRRPAGRCSFALVVQASRLHGSRRDACTTNRGRMAPEHRVRAVAAGRPRRAEHRAMRAARSVAERKSCARQSSDSGPLMRTIPRAAPPGGEAMAAMVSSREYMGERCRDG